MMDDLVTGEEYPEPKMWINQRHWDYLVDVDKIPVEWLHDHGFRLIEEVRNTYETAKPIFDTTKVVPRQIKGLRPKAIMLDEIEKSSLRFSSEDVIDSYFHNQERFMSVTDDEGEILFSIIPPLDHLTIWRFERITNED